LNRKKEIFLIIGIIILAIILIILPLLINNKNETKIIEETEIKDNTITIKVYGEIAYLPPNSISEDDITTIMYFEQKSGISYGEIINYIEVYLTEFSKIENDLTKRYFSDTSIHIESIYDINTEEETIITDGKFNINTATLKDLTKLDGIGNKKAERILNYIKLNGPIESFEKFQEIVDVPDETIKFIKEKAFLQ
jgi:competence ComEA-like helix-hairpin-helix protein